MENSNNNYQNILSKLQECLNEFNCKSEIKISNNDALLYGKLNIGKDRHTIVVHLQDQNFVPVTQNAESIKSKESMSDKKIMPSLNRQFVSSTIPKCSVEEQVAVKQKFEEEAREIGHEFLRKFYK